MIKISTLDFLRAVWEPELKTARDFSSVNDWLLFHKHPLLCILFSVQMAQCLGTVKRDVNLLSLSLFFSSFVNVHTKVLPSVVHNWHTYFMTKETEEFKAVFSNLTSVSEETDFQSNSGKIQLPSTMMSVGVFQWIREFETGGDLWGNSPLLSERIKAFSWTNIASSKIYIKISAFLSEDCTRTFLLYYLEAFP